VRSRRRPAASHGRRGLRLGVGLLVIAAIAPVVGHAQEQAPQRPEITITARNFRYVPDRIEVTEDDLVRLTIRSEDNAYSFVVDEYRIIRRVPAGGSTTFEFRADRPGTFRFYSNLTNDRAHQGMQGSLVVSPR
jgi:heme/copper-type cytochrome/quinol oxidase subunit 2